jgi:CRISPR-associated protein Cmr5
MQGIEQGRVELAYKYSLQGRDYKKNKYDNKKYKSYVRKIPTLIKTNGLAAAIVFIKAKEGGNPAYVLLHEQIFRYLREERNRHLYKEPIPDDIGKLVEKVITWDSDTYRAVTIEIIALFTWMRRFVEGLIEGEAKEDG